MTSDVWLISTPCESEFLGYSGEPTSILYAAAVLWNEVKAGRVTTETGRPLSEANVRLFAWRVLTDRVFQEVEEAVRHAPPRAVCLSATTPTTDHALRIARIIKRHSPETLVLFGGPHEDEIGRVDDPGAARLDAIDVSVAGDGEYILHALVANAIGRESFRLETFLDWLGESPTVFAGLPGAWQVTVRTRRASARVVRWQAVTNRLTDRIPRLPRALLVRDRPHLARTFQIFQGPQGVVPTAQIITERGCAWRCSFCTEWRGTASPGGYRRTLDDVIAEIEEAKKLGYGALFFDDSTMFTGFGSGVPESQLVRKHVGERKEFIYRLFDYLAMSGLEWGCQTRVDTVELDLVIAARDAGCTYIYFGAESASEEQLEDMHKEQSRAGIIWALELVRSAGIRIGLSMLFGMPSAEDPLWTRENELTVEASLAFFASEIRKGGVVVVSRNLTAFYPGSTRTHIFVKNREIDLWTARPQAGTSELDFPWNRFEDGGGHHSRNVTANLATTIVRKSEELLGPWLIKTYIHAHPLEEAGGGHPMIDLVHARADAPMGVDGVAEPRPSPPWFESFDAALHDILEPLVSKAVGTSRGLVPRIVVVGMRILESVRRIAYLRPGGVVRTFPGEVAPHWWPIWNALDEKDLFDRLNWACASPVDAVVLPAVLPETGVPVDLNRVRRYLARTGFDGQLVVDWSDAVLAWPGSDGESADIKTVSLLEPGRILDRRLGCLAMLGVADQRGIDSVARPTELIRAAGHCRTLRGQMINGLTRLNLQMEIVGTTAQVLAPHILAVRLTEVDHFALVKRLWRDHNVLCTFVGPLDLIRFQFGERTSGSDIKTAVDAIAELLPNCLLPKPSEPAPMPITSDLEPRNTRPVDPTRRLARRGLPSRNPEP